MNPSVTATPCQLPLAREPCGQCPLTISHGNLLRIVTALTRPVSLLRCSRCIDQSPPCQRGVPRQRRGGGIPQAGRFPHRFVLSRSTSCESLSQKSKIFASSLWQGSLWGAATKPPWPLWGWFGLPRRGDSAGKACGTSYLFPLHYSLKTFPFSHRLVLLENAPCESLSHGCAVPAPFGKGAFGVQRRSPPGHCGGGLAKPNRGDSPGWQVST